MLVVLTFLGIGMDETVLEGIGAAQQLQNNVGTVPDEVVKLLKQGPAAHLQHHAFEYRRQFDMELAAIRRLKELQLRGVALVGKLFFSALVGAAIRVAAALRRLPRGERAVISGLGRSEIRVCV